MDTAEQALGSRYVEIASNGDAAAIEACYDQGWTDGLPVIPPTADRVLAMLAAGGREPAEILGAIPERNRIITAEKAAINAVLAGCLPEYASVVFTAVEAMTDPRFGLHGPATSTSGMAILLIVNGPVVQRLGIHSGEDVFGPGVRANATIGRALRLILRNVCGSRAGELDRATLGNPARLSYCIAENEQASPWEPLHVQRGLAAGSSAVTVVAGEGPRQVENHASKTPEGILGSVADSMRAAGSFNFRNGSQAVVVIAQEHMQSIADAGWSKADVQRYLHHHARRSLADYKRLGLEPGPVAPGDEEVWRRMLPTPDDALIVAAGGPAGRYSSWLPCFMESPAVTREIPALD